MAIGRESTTRERPRGEIGGSHDSLRAEERNGDETFCLLGWTHLITEDAILDVGPTQNRCVIVLILYLILFVGGADLLAIGLHLTRFTAMTAIVDGPSQGILTGPAIPTGHPSESSDHPIWSKAKGQLDDSHLIKKLLYII